MFFNKDKTIIKIMKKAILFLAILSFWSCFEEAEEETCVQEVEVSDGKGGTFIQLVRCN